MIKLNTDATGVTRPKVKSLIVIVLAQLRHGLQRLAKVVALATCESQQHFRSFTGRSSARTALRLAKIGVGECACGAQ